MQQPASRRTLFAPVAMALAMALALPTFSASPSAAEVRRAQPNINWRLGQTHHVRENQWQRRLIVVIHRGPTSVLQRDLRQLGVRGVQETLWNGGQPPRFRACPTWGGQCIQGNQSVRVMESAIFNQQMELRGALLRASMRNQCLGFMVLDQARRVTRWTPTNCG